MSSSWDSTILRWTPDGVPLCKPDVIPERVSNSYYYLNFQNYEDDSDEDESVSDDDDDVEQDDSAME